MHEHPVITYFDRTGDGQALKISDFMGARAYHRLAIYRKVYQPMAVEDQLAIAVRVDPGFMIGLAFARDRRSFTERDRLCLNLVRPHLIQSYLHAAELASHQEQHLDWQAALRENGLGVVAMDHAGKVLQATPDALECLGRFLPGSPSGPSSLPGRLVQWANSPADPAPFILSRDAARLIVRRVAHGPRIVLLVSEEGGPDDGGRLDRFHLTPREREVLRWIADGKSNAGIAVILGLSVGTVKLHVGRILAKLGVENRTAAALLARENRP